MKEDKHGKRKKIRSVPNKLISMKQFRSAVPFPNQGTFYYLKQPIGGNMFAINLGSTDDER
jgi:hypothetical protein